ncbi:MAG: putative methyltransferase [Myxococcota bacterium]|jgi:predicted methyltransferase
MMKNRDNQCIRRLAFLLLGSVFLLSAGSSHAQQGSVKPGINDKFLADELDVDEWTGKFEGESREIYTHRNEIVAALKLEKKQRVVDVGAGTGFFSELLAEAVGESGQVWALEISPKFAGHLRERFEKAGLSQVEVLENTDRSTGLAESSTNAVFICDVYHHFEYPEAMLANLKFVMGPGAELFIVDFERVEGESKDWVFDHVRAGKEVFRAEIEAAGFIFKEEIEIEGLKDNYVLRFRRP